MTEFLPDELIEQINKSPDKKEVRICTDKDVECFAPLIAEHYLNIARHLERGGTIKPVGKNRRTPAATLTQNPLSVELRGADESGKRLFKYFVGNLNDELAKRDQEAIWWLPDSSNYRYRYFWMFSYNSSEKNDFITIVNIKSRSDFGISFFHFREELFMSKEKTSVIDLIRALYHSQDGLPSLASIKGVTLKDWCSIAEAAFARMGLKVYCHTSLQKCTLLEHAKQNGESDRLQRADYLCDIQWDIAKLNRDTNDPKGDNTDRLFFPHGEHWVFYNNSDNRRLKGINLQELNKQYQRTKDQPSLVNRKMDYRSLNPPTKLAEEVSSSEANVMEGATTNILVNSYERDPEARIQCIKHHGFKCFICGLDFFETYGELGRDFIHIHHLIPLSQVKQAHKINPVNDLIPICPNCHAVVHRRNPPFSPAEVRAALKK